MPPYRTSRAAFSDRHTEPPGPDGSESPDAPSAGKDPPTDVLELRGLSVTFQRDGASIEAVRGVDLRIGRGEIIGLAGESGSGKSVLARSILGLTAHTPGAVISGEALVEGEDMLAARPAERRRLLREKLGVVFQDPMTSLNPSMQIGRQLAEACSDEDEVVTTLESVGMPHARSRLTAYPHQLSGGQRQRVMIAMALAREPSLVVADEPTTALDVTVQDQILELLCQMRDDRGCSFLLITHDLGVAAEVADRIAVMYAGQIMEIGSVAQILGHPRHPYTIGLLQSRLDLSNGSGRSELPSLPGAPPKASRIPAGCPFVPRCPLAEPACSATSVRLLPVSAGQFSSCRRWEKATTSTVQFESEPVVHGEPRSRTPSAPEGAIVKLEGARKQFERRSGWRRREQLVALRELDLAVRRGEAVAIVGESGSGKSTLLRVIAGILDLDEGICEVGPDANPRMVFQDAGASLTPWLKIAELLGEPFSDASKEERSALVAAALDRVGLSQEVRDARPGQLSGGQAQRVAMARAVAGPVKLLLADEPTSALDVSLAAAVLNLLAELRREFGLSIIFVTHDLAVARHVSDRIAVMHLGQLVELGPTDEVISDPKHPYTKMLLAAVPGARAARVAPRGEPPDPMNPPPGCSFADRCPYALDACRAELPSLDAWSKSLRHAACIRVDEIDRSGTAPAGSGVSS